MKINMTVTGVVEYAKSKGQVTVHADPSANNSFFDALKFTANKSAFEPGDKIEVVVTNYTKGKS